MTVTTESVRGYKTKVLERVAFQGYLASDQSNLADGVWTKVNIDTITYDLGGNFNTGTYLFTVPVTGRYTIRGKVDFSNTIANKSYAVGIYLNASLTWHSYSHTGASATEVQALVGATMYLNTGDTIELYALADAGVSTVDVGSGLYHTTLECVLDSKEGI